jgi:hypothetical protein
VAIEEENVSAVYGTWCREVALPINRKGYLFVKADQGAGPAVALTVGCREEASHSPAILRQGS